MGLKQLNVHLEKKISLDPASHHTEKIICNRSQTVKAKTIKILKENLGEHLCNLWLSKDIQNTESMNE